MTQQERDRLVVLKKAHKQLITQRQAAEELQLTERHVRRLLGCMKEAGDRVVIHGLRGRESNRKLSPELREQAVRILSQEVYRGFGPTLASEYLAKKHKLKIGREALVIHGRKTRFHHMIAPVTNIAAGTKPKIAQVAFVA